MNLIIKTLILYIFILICYRLMGKREIGELNTMDLINSILIGNLAASTIENKTDPLYTSLIPISILVLIEISLSYLTLKNRKFKLKLNGEPVQIIKNGKIIYNNMISQRYTIDDLLLSLRQNNITSIKEVNNAYLEINGSLSIIKNNKNPMPLIIEGKIDYKILSNINKSKKWLINILNKNNLSINDIYYAIYQNNELFIIKYK